MVLTDVAVAIMFAARSLVVGWEAFLLIQMPSLIMAGMAGVWLFYVQHQFEDVYWENAESWSYADAALRGSSYLKLPKILQLFTGNIGLHHVHHLERQSPTTTSRRARRERDLPRRAGPDLLGWHQGHPPQGHRRVQRQAADLA